MVAENENAVIPATELRTSKPASIGVFYQMRDVTHIGQPGCLSLMSVAI